MRLWTWLIIIFFTRLTIGFVLWMPTVRAKYPDRQNQQLTINRWKDDVTVNTGRKQIKQYHVIRKGQLRGIGKGLKYMKFSPDGKKVLIGNDGRDASIWNVDTGRMMYQLKGASSGESGIFSLDGRYILTNPPRSVAIWEADAGRLLVKTKTGAGLLSLGKIHDYTQDGRQVLASDGCNVLIIEVPSGKIITRADLKGKLGDTDVSFSPDGKLFAASCFSKSVAIYEVPSGRQIISLPTPHYTIFARSVFSRNGKALFVNCNSGVDVWEVVTWKKLASLYQEAEVNRIMVSPDDKYLAAYGAGDMAILWDWRAGKISRKLTGHGGYVWAATFSSDGKKIAVGSRLLKLWDVETGGMLFFVENEGKYIQQIEFTQNDELLIFAGKEKVLICDSKSGNPLAKLDEVQAPFIVSPDGKFLAAKGKNGDILLWELRDT